MGNKWAELWPSQCISRPVSGNSANTPPTERTAEPGADFRREQSSPVRADNASSAPTQPPFPQSRGRSP